MQLTLFEYKFRPQNINVEDFVKHHSLNNTLYLSTLIVENGLFPLLIHTLKQQAEYQMNSNAASFKLAKSLHEKNDSRVNHNNFNVFQNWFNVKKQSYEQTLLKYDAFNPNSFIDFIKTTEYIENDIYEGIDNIGNPFTTLFSIDDEYVIYDFGLNNQFIKFIFESYFGHEIHPDKDYLIPKKDFKTIHDLIYKESDENINEYHFLLNELNRLKQSNEHDYIVLSCG